MCPIWHAYKLPYGEASVQALSIVKYAMTHKYIPGHQRLIEPWLVVSYSKWNSLLGLTASRLRPSHFLDPARAYIFLSFYERTTDGMKK